MKRGSNNKRVSVHGMTLMESALVILVLLGLVSVMFVAARGWQRGADRTLCVLNQHQVQKAVRGYANLHGKREGEEIPGLAVLLFGDGKFIENVPLCPADGIYSFRGEEIPPRGELYMSCSLAVSGEHQPADVTGW